MDNASYFKQSIPKTIPNLLWIPIKNGEAGEEKEKGLKMKMNNGEVCFPVWYRPGDKK